MSDPNKVAISVQATLGFDGAVSGRVVGKIASHVKKADDSTTDVAATSELTKEELAKIQGLFAEIAAAHTVRVTARAIDERSTARAGARRRGEIKE